MHHSYVTTNSGPLRVILVDDRFLCRRGMEIVLSAQEGIEVVGVADHTIDATGVAALAPDVVILDPDWDTLSRVRSAAPRARILMLDPDEAGPAADGHVARNVSGEELAMAVRRVGTPRDAR